ncbi:hypothetical protein BDZ91DRAFT_853436 [Kalaharituber pfeilii]|nr:hypothetical protein BDZ91DRAFT_853436 [Kalaharituber pfeilii]
MSSHGSQQADQSEHASPQNPAEPLIARCSALLDEIHLLQAFIKQNHLPYIELRAFRSHVESELKFLKKISSRGDPFAEERTQHALRSSNLGYFELVWAAAKASTGLTSILTHVHETGLQRSTKQEKNVKAVQVEVVAEDGLQWIKLNAVTPKRLMYELAKVGWEAGSEAPSDDQEEASGVEDEVNEWNQQAISEIPLIKHADLLSKAAKCTWVKYKHPQIIYLFQNIHLKTSTAPIRQIIKRLKQTRATVYCADDPTPTALCLSNPRTIYETLDKLKSRNQYANFSQALNIDCTILLALASDISNSIISPTSRAFNRAILTQLKNELVRPLLPSILFQVLSGRALFCTKTARQRFEEIIDEIGTATEKARAQLILGTYTSVDPGAPVTSHLFYEKFQALCIHPVPTGFSLPIRTLDEEYFSGPYPQASKISEQLTPINQSVFMTGWMKGLTTITSNMAVGKVVQANWTQVLEDMERGGGHIGGLGGPDCKRNPDSIWVIGKGPSPKGMKQKEEELMAAANDEPGTIDKSEV